MLFLLQFLHDVPSDMIMMSHQLPDLQSIYNKLCSTKAMKIMKDLSHPNNGLFSLLRSGKCFHSLKANTERMRRIFFLQVIWALNQGNTKD